MERGIQPGRVADQTMDGGRIVGEGPPEAIFTPPRRERTAAFLARVLHG